MYFIDPDGMEATPAEDLDMNDPNANVKVNLKPEVKVYIGYGRMRNGNNLSIAAGFSVDFGGGSSYNGLIKQQADYVLHTTLLERFKKDENGKHLVDPDGSPDFSQKGANNLMNSVEGLNSTYKEAGNPEIRFTLTGKEDAGLADSSWINFNKSQITTNYRYASIFFHELRHVIQYNHLIQILEALDGNIGGKGGVWEMMELDAYRFQQRMGDDSSYIKAKIQEHSRNIQIMEKK